jgi:hypothetical protein
VRQPLVDGRDDEAILNLALRVSQSRGPVGIVADGESQMDHLLLEFARRCAATLGCPMDSAGRSRITWLRSRSITSRNFIKIHCTLRVSPAMAAGVSKRLMDVPDLVNLLIESEAKKAA